jgi:hypothetical protein
MTARNVVQAATRTIETISSGLLRTGGQGTGRALLTVSSPDCAASSSAGERRLVDLRWRFAMNELEVDNHTLDSHEKPPETTKNDDRIATTTRDFKSCGFSCFLWRFSVV